MSTIAGVGCVLGESAGDGGAATSATLSPERIAIDSLDNIYVTDQYRIRKFSEGGIISTVAGSGPVDTSTPVDIENYASTKGDGDSATIGKISPTGNLVVNSQGTIYFADVWGLRVVANNGCNVGYFSSTGSAEAQDGSSSCSECPVGKHSRGFSAGCYTCTPGSFSSTSAGASCSRCAEGQYCSSFGCALDEKPA